MRKIYRIIGFFLAISVVAGIFIPPTLSAGEDEDKDIGLGGTGMFANSGNGLGGTGIVGEITGFGSIFVNGVEIEYHDATPFTVDGKKVTKKQQLEIGDVVEVLTTDDNKHTQAMMINLRHEVIGVVESVNDKERSFTVHGQVVLSVSKHALPEVGDRVAVSGFRIDDRTIQSTRVGHIDGKQTLLRTHTELPFKKLTDRWLVQAYVQNGKASFQLDSAAHAVALEEKQTKPLAAHTGISILQLQKTAKGQLKHGLVSEPGKMKRGATIRVPLNRPDGIKRQKQGPGPTPVSGPSEINRGPW